MNNLALQLFLLLNAMLVGGLAVIAYRHARAHFKPDLHIEEKKPTVQLPAATKARLLEQAEAQFQSILDHNAKELQRDLKFTAEDLHTKLQKLGSEIVDAEMKRYRESLELLRAQAETTVKSATQEVTTHQEELRAALATRQTELEAKLEADVAAEKAQLIQQIDTKLGDAAVSFLMETLQHNVDLGAQTGYLTSVLDAHKEDFKREVVGDETATAK